MGLIELFFVAFVHLAMVGLDIIGFFIVVRLCRRLWPGSLLIALDRVGSPIVERLIDAMAQSLHIAKGQRLEPIAASAWLVVIALARLGMVTLVR